MDSPFIFFPAPSSVISCLFLWSAEVLFFFSSQVGQIHWEMRKNKPKFLWEIPPPPGWLLFKCGQTQKCFYSSCTVWADPIVSGRVHPNPLHTVGVSGFVWWFFLFGGGMGVCVLCFLFFFFFVLLQSTTFDNVSDPFFFCSFVYLILCRLNRKLQTSILMYLQASKLVQTI